MPERRKKTTKPSLTSNLAKLMSGIPDRGQSGSSKDESTNVPVNQLTDRLVNESTNTPVNQLTDQLVNESTNTPVNQSDPIKPKEKTLIKGFHLFPLDFDALNLYATSRKEDMSSIVRRMIRENIPEFYFEMAKAIRNEGKTDR